MCSFCKEEKPEAGKILGFPLCERCGLEYLACDYHLYVVRKLDILCDECQTKQRPALKALIFVRRVREARNDRAVEAPL